MLNETAKENYKDINCFSHLESINTNKESISTKIKQYRKNMEISYKNDQLFEEIMPTIQKQSKMNNIYQALIKNGLKYNSQIIRLIYRTITNINMRRIQKIEKEKKKEINPYNLPKIDRLKNQKEKYDNLNIKKIKILKLNKEKLEEYKTKMRSHINTSMDAINESAKINNRPKLLFNNISPISNSSTKNLEKYNNHNYIDFTNETNDPNKKTPINKNILSFKKSLTPTPTNISMIDLSTISTNKITKKIIKKNNLTPVFRSEKKNNDSFILSNISKSFDIMEKCDEEVKKGNDNKKDIFKYKKDFDKSIHQRINSQDLLDLDHKVLEERKKLNNKYTRQQEKNIRRIKKQLKERISDNFAYENRKELMELLKVDQNAQAYNLHLIEMDKVNQDILKRIDGERKKINKVKLMADDGYCKSIVINKIMDEINAKNRRIKKYSASKKVIFPEKFLIPKVKNFGLKGDLVPNIIHIRKKEMKNIGHNRQLLNKI